MSYLGDFRLGDTFDFKFTTRTFSTGAPGTLAGTPVISAYPGNSTTQLTAGITLSVDFDTVTGLNNVRVVASSGNGYATATNYALVITTGTVSSVSVVGEVVGHFSIENRSALMPTTATRTLDVSAGGEAGVDWANVGSPTTTVGLTGTTISSSQVAASVTGNVGGNVAGSVGSVTGNVGGIAGTITTLDALDTAQDTQHAQTQSDIAGLNDPTAAAIADAVWDEDIVSAHTTAATAGRALRIAGLILSETTLTGTPSSTSMQLTAGSAVDNYYNDLQLVFINGNCAGQARIITSYTGATKTVTFDEATVNTPSSGDQVIIRAFHNHTRTQVRDSILADSTAFNGADIASILTDTGTTLPGTLGTPAGADLATDIAAIKTVVDVLSADDIPGLIAALNDPSSATIVAGLLAAVVESEGSYTLKQALSIILSVCAGITTDSGATFKTPNGNSTRVAATTNASNERTGMTLTPSS